MNTSGPFLHNLYIYIYNTKVLYSMYHARNYEKPTVDRDQISNGSCTSLTRDVVFPRWFFFTHDEPTKEMTKNVL
jgi:hypothetical protein